MRKMFTFDVGKGYVDFLNSLIKFWIEMPWIDIFVGYPLMSVFHSIPNPLNRTQNFLVAFLFPLAMLVIPNKMPQCCSTLSNDNNGIKTKETTTTKKLFTFFSVTPFQNEWMNIWAQIKLQLKNVFGAGFLVLRNFCAHNFSRLKNFFSSAIILFPFSVIPFSI